MLVIGNQSRPNLFDLSVRKPGMLYTSVLEIDERVLLADQYQIEGAPVMVGTTGEKVQICKAPGEYRNTTVLKDPDVETVRQGLQALYDQGLRSLSIALLHSYTYPAHEELVGKIALDVGFSHVSLSSQLSPMVRIVPRAHSATADAYLTPELKRYLQGYVNIWRSSLICRFQQSFKNLRPGMLQFMQSDGGRESEFET